MVEQYHRIGDQNKCPACGWRVDAEAYRCPKCLIYFCYKCRARVTKNDPQYQCANQSCDSYGKLTCSACTAKLQEFLYQPIAIEIAPAQTIKGEYWGWAVLIIPTIIGTWLWSKYTFALGFCGWILTFTAIAVKWKIKIPAKTEWIRGEKYVSAEHLTCIQCGHPIKNLQ